MLLILTLTLAWMFTNLVFMLHYTHMHYGRAPGSDADLGVFDFPGTPEPVATLIVDALTYRQMATKVTTPLKALASGKLKVEGSWLGFLAFNRRFELE